LRRAGLVAVVGAAMLLGACGGSDDHAGHRTVDAHTPKVTDEPLEQVPGALVGQIDGTDAVVAILRYGPGETTGGTVNVSDQSLVACGVAKNTAMAPGMAPAEPSSSPTTDGAGPMQFAPETVTTVNGAPRPGETTNGSRA
jgi:hypothetical protein